MSKYAPLTLRTIAAITSATSAVADYPAAANLFGNATRYRYNNKLRVIK